MIIEGSILLVFFALAIAALVAWLLAINLLIKTGMAKGYSMSNTGILWFIGIFASPIVLGIYIMALPDKSARSQDAQDAPVEELPSL